MYGDVVPLHHVAEAMARYAASGYGKSSLHGPTLKNTRANSIGLLLDAADRGLLIVCDGTGRICPAEDIINAAVLPPVQDGFDLNSRRIMALHVRVKHLCEWGRSNGDEFHIEEAPVEVIEFDLKNEQGKIIEKGFYRGYVGSGYVGSGTHEPVPPTAALPLPPAEVPVSKPPASGPRWMLRKPKRFQGYGPPLYSVLKAAHAAGLPRPTARYVLDEFTKNKPIVILCVSSDSMDYQNGNGDKVTADLDAIRVAIGRLTQIADDPHE